MHIPVFFRPNRFIWLLCILFFCQTSLLHGGPTTVTVVAAPNPAIFGGPLTLTATVTPSSATGKVTFYDGALVLGTAVLSGGQAARTVHLYSTGRRSLSAHYLGDAGNAPSTSAPITQVVNSTAAYGFTSTAVDMNLFLAAVAVGDFNGDGKADLAVANSGTNDVSILLGNGDGTFGVAVNYAAGSFPESVAMAASLTLFVTIFTKLHL